MQLPSTSLKNYPLDFSARAPKKGRLKGTAKPVRKKRPTSWDVLTRKATIRKLEKIVADAAKGK